MAYQQETFAYQAAAASGATQAGLLQLVYNHLAKDLLRAADAAHHGDIQGRCAASHHALLLLGHLESWVQQLQEPGLATSLKAFYQMLRASILQLQAEPKSHPFEQLAQFVLETSLAWQSKEQSLSPGLHSGAPTFPADSEVLSFQA